MKLTKSLLYISSITLLTACSDDTATTHFENDIVLTDNPIEISANVNIDINTGSRFGSWQFVGEFTDNGTHALDKFMVWGYYGSTKFANGEIVNRDINTNVCSRTNGMPWYWPLLENVNMYAVAPTNFRSGEAFDDNSTANYNIVENNDGTITLKNIIIPSAPNVDLIYADVTEHNYNTAQGKIEFNFQHALSAIDVYIVNYSPYLDVAFAEADFNCLKYKGDFKLPNISTKDGGRGEWINISNDITTHHTDKLGTGYSEIHKEPKSASDPTLIERERWYAKAPAHTGEGIPQEVSVFSGEKSLFMLPQKLAKWQKGDNVSLVPCLCLRGYIKDIRTGEYLYNVFCYDGHSQAGASQNIVIPLAWDGHDTWEPGKRYKYVISFGQNNGENMGWTDWNDAIAVPVGFAIAASYWDPKHYEYEY